MNQPGLCSSTVAASISHLTTGLLLILIPVYFILQIRDKTTTKYGKHSDDKRQGVKINPTIGWVVQEAPSFFTPLAVYLYAGHFSNNVTVNEVLMVMFSGHYCYRSIIYPFFFKRGGQPLPLAITISATVFTTLNGFTQTKAILCASYQLSWVKDTRFLIGVTVFTVGLLINIHSDYILRNLRKPGQSGYKIPKGGMFEYVSSANFFGEIVEWFGFAIACWTSIPAWVFALHTLATIGNRGVAHHRYYIEKFEDYPKNRKAVIPWVW